MKKLFRISIFVFSILLFAHSSFANQPQKYTLDNGISIILKDAPGTGLVAVNVFIKASPLNETHYDAGISQLVGRMLKEGTKLRSAEQIADELDNIGAKISISNNSDFTEASYISLSKDLVTGFDLLSDILQKATFPQKQINKRKKDMLSSIKMIDDNPDSIVYEEVLHLIYGNHPYGFREKQKIPNINRFSRYDLIKFYKKHFVAQNIVVSIVGDIDKELSLKLCKLYFDFDRGVGDGSQDIWGSGYPGKIKKNLTKNIIKKDLKANWIEISYLGPSVDDPDYVACKVLNDILGSGMSSRLFRNIREKYGLVYSIGSFFPTRKQKSNLTIYAIASPDNSDQVQEYIFDEIESIKSDKVSVQELKRAKTYLNGKFIIDHQSLSRQAWYLGWFETLGLGYKTDYEFKNMVNSVTADDILRVAKKYLKTHVSVILTP